jgi:hypothetical protein
VKIPRDFRKTVEFILRMKNEGSTVYTEADLLRKDIFTFLDMLDECEAEATRRIEESKKGE